MSVLIFFFGGMLIHPLGILIAKLMNRSGKHKAENPLAKLALESTLLLFIGLFIAYLMLPTKPAWFFPIMLMIIGGRYVLFQTIYGMRLYWVLGLLLILAGLVCLILNQSFHYGAVIGGGLELIFAMLILKGERKV